MNPKVSIIMSAYNAERFLAQSIESILSQTFKDFEFIIINDATLDNSREIVQKYASIDARIRLFDNEKNIGLTKSLNKAIALTRGEYVARMDADDISLPERLALEVSFLDTHSEYGLVGTWADIIDENNKVTRTVKYPTENEELKRVLIKYNPFWHSSIMVRRALLSDVGLYDEQWRYAQDYELFLRVSKKYKVANIAQVLLQYREIPESITASKNRAQIGFVLRAKIEALKNGQYPVYKSIYIIPTMFSWLLPVSVKRFIKNILKK